MADLKVFKDNSAESNILFDVQHILPEFNELITLFNELPLSNITSIEDCKQLISDLPGLMESKLSGTTIIGGVTLTPKQTLEVLKLDVSEIEKKRRQFVGGGFYNGKPSLLFAVCDVVNNLLEVNETKLNTYIDQNTQIILTTTAQKALYNDYLAMVDKVEAFTNKYKIHPETFLLAKSIEYFTELGTTHLNGYGVNKQKFVNLLREI